MKNEYPFRTCPCRVCRSDLVNIMPCEIQDSIEFALVDPTRGPDNEQLNTPDTAETISG